MKPPKKFLKEAKHCCVAGDVKCPPSMRLGRSTNKMVHGEATTQIQIDLRNRIYVCQTYIWRLKPNTEQVIKTLQLSWSFWLCHWGRDSFKMFIADLVNVRDLVSPPALLPRRRCKSLRRWKWSLSFGIQLATTQLYLSFEWNFHISDMHYGDQIKKKQWQDLNMFWM